MACNHEVLDVTGYSDRELAAAFLRNEGNICGRMSRSQQHRQLDQPMNVAQRRPLYANLMALLMTASVTTGFASGSGSSSGSSASPVSSSASSTASSAASSAGLLNVSGNEGSGDGGLHQGTQPVPASDTLPKMITLTGHIKTSDGMPLRGIRIHVTGQSANAETDSLGNFRFQVYQAYTGEVFLLTASSRGYLPKEFNMSELMRSTNLVFEEEAVVTMGIIQRVPDEPVKPKTKLKN